MRGAPLITNSKTKLITHHSSLITFIRTLTIQTLLFGGLHINRDLDAATDQQRQATYLKVMPIQFGAGAVIGDVLASRRSAAVNLTYIQHDLFALILNRQRSRHA